MKAPPRRANGYLDRLRRDPRVMFVDDERAIGNSIIITLREGWTIDPLDPHAGVFGGDTIAEVRETLRHAKRFEPRPVSRDWQRIIESVDRILAGEDR